MIINHNLIALQANNQHKKNIGNASKVMGKLASGLRINQAADDAAGLAISEKMRAQIRGLAQAAKNIQDGVSLIQTAESGLDSILDPPLQRMRELAVHAVNDTLTDEDRDALNQEFGQLKQSIDGVANDTHFNGIPLLNQAPQTVTHTTTSLTGVKRWDFVDPGFDFTPVNIVYNGSNQYVATGIGDGAGMLVYSSDGETWNKANTQVFASNLAYGNGVYVIAGRDMRGMRIMSSTDGINWNTVTTNSPLNMDAFEPEQNSIAFDGSKFVITGYSSTEGLWKTLTSTDGVHWNVYANPDRVGFITYADGQFAGTGYQNIFTSEDGINWTIQADLSAYTLSYGFSRCPIVYEGDKYFVYGERRGTVLIKNSDDPWEGMDWNQVDVAQDTTFTITDMAYNGSQYLALGTNGYDGKTNVYSSPDGVNWMLDKTFASTGSREQSSVIWDGHRFIASSVGGFEIGSVDTVTENQTETILGKSILNIQAGVNANEFEELDLCNVTTEALGIQDLEISSSSGAIDALSKIDEAIQTVSSHRSRMGAYQNALEHALNNVENSETNMTTSESKIRDTDIAKDMMEMTKDNILSQAAQFIVAQGNQTAEIVLQLLKQ
ncbi:flagellin [Heyndrickxia coagulans]|uniref:Flagellin n=1 Tax=Heyndrickxia coagulans TaxID=1398 RepID=A0A133KTF1_HEYCO|nr:flagellin [Heyndrickxia coagulans]KWZ82959.1 bacterial flagellin [Heyndrickxia coagulans]